MAENRFSGYIRASARARSPPDVTHAVDSRGGGTVRSRFGMRSAGLLFGVLALALGGCGTLPASRGSHIHPAFLESPPSSFARPPASSGGAARAEAESVAAPATEAAAVAPESRGETGAAVEAPAGGLTTDAPPPAFVPVALEP